MLKKCFLAVGLGSALFNGALISYERSSSTTLIMQLSELKNYNQDSERFCQFCSVYWDFAMKAAPETATYVGYHGQNARWTNYSSQAFVDQMISIERLLDSLHSINYAALSKQDQLSYDLLNRDLEEWKEDLSYGSYYLCINQMSSVHLDIQQTFSIMPTVTVGDYEDIIARMKAVPALIDQVIVLLSEGLAKGITPPKITLRDVPQQILNQITDDPTASAFFLPFAEFPDTIGEPEQQWLVDLAQQSICQDIFVSYRKLHDFLIHTYIPGARETIAMSDLPNGNAWYAYKVRSQTTTDLTPDEIHQIGLAEVKRIHHEMRQVIKDVKFEGTFDDFIDFLVNDPQFTLKSREDILQGYREILTKVEAKLPELFGKLPNLPCEVVAVPEFSERSQPSAYYMGGSLKNGRPGYFFANTYDLKTRPSWDMESLALHEALPGHHLQITLAQEIDTEHEFRRYSRYTAFIEGWGLYSESLGKELGLYTCPYSYFGRLTAEMMRAVRLVVDTGMHAKGWTRQEAIDYFSKNATIGKHKIIAEVDRYLVIPGQALSYKIGEIKIKQLRALSEKTLGNRFDIRAFHDELLSYGSVPLDVAESQINLWLKREIPSNGL